MERRASHPGKDRDRTQIPVFVVPHPSSNRLAYIDGFSGPGRYLNSDQNSDQSSPIAALTSAKAAFDELVGSGRAPTEWYFEDT